MTNSARKTISVGQGKLAVSSESHIVLSAILGSCVATCIWDPDIRVGGMNHILLPGDNLGHAKDNKYGVFAMEALINALMKQGACKSNMLAKVFGGATTFENRLGIGEANTRFTREFLKHEGIPITAESTGGRQARRLRFLPESGRARQFVTGESWLEMAQNPNEKDQDGTSALPDISSGEIDLF